MRLTCFSAPTVLNLHCDVLNAVMCVGILHTHCLMNILANLCKMKAQIETSSISMSKTDPNLNKFEKYDVEANIEEIENREDKSVFKYGFTALSNPKNVRLSIEGIAKIFGDSAERDEILNKDENDIPKILTMIYQELFPTFFLLSKNLNVSCPPHQIGEMGNGIENNSELSNENNTLESESESTLESADSEPTKEEPLESETNSQTQNNTEEQKLENPDISQPTV